ncbi:MAG: deoxyribodipyrimidine photo-lyase [Bacteroidales bacterium]|nr:deoxyribodipyrimidine photo-lyase [Bacteroidales bacterium]MDY0217660.1 deoxyribodipyrimidine photo-lyase [Bacteroidales bacterium]
MKENLIIFWFRRDLRWDDNHALFEALSQKKPVLPIYIFDVDVLKRFSNADNKAVSLIYKSILRMNEKLESFESSISVFHDSVENVFNSLLQKYNVQGVYANEDYESYGIKRDENIFNLLKKKNIQFHLFQDHLIFKPGKILKKDDTPYLIYTPFSKIWKEEFFKISTPHYSSEELLSNLYKNKKSILPKIEDLGFRLQDVSIDFKFKKDVLLNYHDTRDFPYLEKGTSGISPFLRFGLISVREAVRIASLINEKFLNELIWREFFMHILWHFPHVENRSFKTKYDAIEWSLDETAFLRWCNGETGYTLVDAGMRQLNSTGLIHGRVRMLTASFLVKHLQIDWRWGEAYFAQKLLDYELSSNNGNWQWAAGCGCDAAPYFRLFNPDIQRQKFDPNFEYVKKWVPEYQQLAYQNNRIVDLKIAKEKTMRMYKLALE